MNAYADSSVRPELHLANFPFLKGSGQSLLGIRARIFLFAVALINLIGRSNNADPNLTSASLTPVSNYTEYKKSCISANRTTTLN